MISIQVTIAEAIAIANTAGNDLHDRIVKSIEVALGINQSRDVTITKMPGDSRIPCIRAIRSYSGWGLKEAKEWTDVLVGHYDSNIGRWVSGGNDNTIKLQTPEKAESLLRDLTSLGCEGFLS